MTAGPDQYTGVPFNDEMVIMEKILHFAANHWILVVLFIIVFVWLMIEEAKGKGLGSGITPQKVVEMINRENAIILDIRDAGLFAQGHIVGSLNIPLSEVERRISQLEKHKQNALIIVCGTGQKATSLANKLKKQGYDKVCVLSGGLNAWKSAKMPLAKD